MAKSSPWRGQRGRCAWRKTSATGHARERTLPIAGSGGTARPRSKHMTSTRKFTRRAALAGMGLALGVHALDRRAGTAVAAQPRQPTRDPLAAIPINGQAGPGLEPFD